MMADPEPDARLKVAHHAMFVYSSEYMRITSKAPCRIDLAGATLDIWPLYLFHCSPVTVNFAVDRYTSCVLETRDDSIIELKSLDLKKEESFASLEALR